MIDDCLPCHELRNNLVEGLEKFRQKAINSCELAADDSLAKTFSGIWEAFRDLFAETFPPKTFFLAHKTKANFSLCKNFCCWLNIWKKVSELIFGIPKSLWIYHELFVR